MKKTTKIFAMSLIAVLVVALSMTAFVASPVSVETTSNDEVSCVVAKDYNNPYITYNTEGGLLLSAHRAGGDLFPENTFGAIKECLSCEFENDPSSPDYYKVDVLEFDLHLTKDGELILLHDDNFDRTTNSVEIWGQEGVLPSSKTLDEIKELNFGYWYPYERDDSGIDDSERIYMDLDNLPEGVEITDLQVVTLKQVFDYVENNNSSKNFIIEIKDSGTIGKRATDKLCAMMNEYNLFDKVVVGTFNGDISDYFDELNKTTYNGKIIRSAGILEVLKIFFSYLMNRDLGTPAYRVLQIPYLDWFPFLGNVGFIKYAHSYGIACQYWTINDADQMETLIQNGADCIMSDNPKLLYQVDQVVKYS